jgi:hypothetical protein
MSPLFLLPVLYRLLMAAVIQGRVARVVVTNGVVVV